MNRRRHLSRMLLPFGVAILLGTALPRRAGPVRVRRFAGRRGDLPGVFGLRQLHHHLDEAHLRRLQRRSHAVRDVGDRVGEL